MNKRLVFAVVLTAVLSCFTAAAVSSAAPEPGSEGDPLVSRSYVDKRISEVMNVLSSGTGTTASDGLLANDEEIMAQIEYLVKENIDKSSASAFAPVSVKAGETLVGGEGCEIILRSGKGVIITSTDSVVNVTSGKDMKAWEEVPLSNLLIIPRNDGRGVKVTHDAWFIVKGVYAIR